MPCDADKDNGGVVTMTVNAKGSPATTGGVKIQVNAALGMTTRIINGWYTNIRDRQSRFDAAKKALGI